MTEPEIATAIPIPPSVRRTAALTCLALTGFAANSILCRMALGRESIDATSFTTVRIVAGAFALAALVGLRRRPDGATSSAGDAGATSGAATHVRAAWPGALALFTYALAFSHAYRRLGAGVGAFILFTVVQATMIGAGLARGDQPSARQWAGIALALAGLGWLTRPGLAAPDPLGAALMAAAGIAWGAYSLRGRGTRHPLLTTAASFAGAVPLAAAASAIALGSAHASARGIALAALSGALTSGIGYALWYGALAGLTPAQAAVVQLAVPVLAAAGGVAFLGETVRARLAIAAACILGGITLVVTGRSRTRAAPGGPPAAGIAATSPRAS